MRCVRGLGMENESNEPWGTCPTFFMRTARLPRAIQARGKAFFPRWHFDVSAIHSVANVITLKPKNDNCASDGLVCS